jgi:hypothetical protein
MKLLTAMLLASSLATPALPQNLQMRPGPVPVSNAPANIPTGIDVPGCTWYRMDPGVSPVIQVCDRDTPDELIRRWRQTPERSAEPSTDGQKR